MIRHHQLWLAESLQDLVSWLNETKPIWHTRISQEMNTGSWTLGVTYKQALDYAVNGWHEGTQNLSDAIRAYPPHVGFTPKHSFDIAGEQPDIGRYCAGNPAHMGRRGKEHGHKPIINLLVTINARSSVTAKQFVNYGAALCAIVDKLESSNRRVEITVASVAMFASKHRMIHGWKVKHAKDPLDLAAVAFSIGHPAALRRLAFAMYERSPVQYADYSYAKPLEVNQEDAKRLDLEGAFLMNGIGDGTCSTLAAALTYAAKQINKAAGEDLVSLDD